MSAEPFAKALARHLVLALPVVLASWLLSGLLGRFLENRLAVAAVALPLGVASWVLWRLLARDRSVLLGRRFFLFLLAYCLLFAVLAGTDVLTWKRTLVGYDEQVPRHWLGRFLPPRLADWRYALAPAAPAARDLLVVTLARPEGLERGAGRREFAFLVHQAVARRAKGIAFDYYLEGSAPVVDPFLCRAVAAADAAGVPVLFGYRYEERGGTVVPRALAPTLAPCLRPDRLGSLSGYLEADGRMRRVPLFLRHNEAWPSLALQVARLLAAGEPARPPGDLVQFLRPAGGVTRFAGLPRGDDLALFAGSFVLVGTDAATDRVDTPFGPLQGVEVLTWAAHALREGAFVRPLPAAWTFPAIFALCYLLAWTLARRGGFRRLLGLAAALSAAVVAVAALALRLALVWVDVSYPLAAMWGLVGLFAIGSGALGRRRPAAERPPPAEAGPDAVFDVFLSHNGRDKPAVRELAAALRTRGLRPWLDEDELVPGRPWQEALEEIIARARTAAVLTGPDGLGPWEEMEMRACLAQFVERRKPVIPVLLPGSPARPNLPLFLTQFTWVDLRERVTGPGLDRLVWGVTGTKPARS
jgi:hypothetical protein